MNNLTKQASKPTALARVVEALKPSTREHIEVSRVFQNNPFPVDSSFEFNPITVNFSRRHRSEDFTYKVENLRGLYSDYDGKPIDNFEITYSSQMVEFGLVADGIGSMHQMWNTIANHIKELEA